MPTKRPSRAEPIQATSTSTALAAPGSRLSPGAVPDGRVGEAVPMRLGPIAPDGSWVIWCTKVEGSSARAVLETPHRKVELTQYLGQSSDGLRAAYVEQGKTIVLDVTRDERIELDSYATLARDPASPPSIVQLQFHPTRQEVAFVEQSEEKAALHILNWVTGEHSNLILPFGVQALTWDPSGRALYVDEPRANHGVRFPKESAKVPPICLPPEPRGWFSAAQSRPLTRHIYMPGEATLTPAQGEVLFTKDGAFVAREPHRLGYRKGPEFRPLTPPSCEAYVLGTSPVTERVLVGCNDKGRMQLGLMSSTRFEPLGLDIAQVFDLEDRVFSSELIPLYAGSRTHVIDLAANKVVPLKDRDQVLAQAGGALLVRNGTSINRILWGKGESHPLDVTPKPGAKVLLTRGWAYVAPYVISAEPRESEPLVVEGRVLALTEQGCALTESLEAKHSANPMGPLRWVCAPNARQAQLAATH